MRTERLVGTILLAMAIIFGVVLSVIPLGDAWAEEDGARTTETYGMFTKVREINPSGQAADGDGATWYYVDEGLDASGGITYLRAMGLMLGAALLLSFVALLLTSLPRVNRTRAGAWVALPATLLFAAAFVLALVGTEWHAADKVGAAAVVDLNTAALAVAALGILSLAIATGLGFIRGQREPTQIVQTAPSGAGERRLRCPECSTVVATGYGLVPICPGCGFGADYEGPAGPPVPAQAVS